MTRRLVPAGLLLLRAALGAPFLWAGFLKASDPILFAQTLRAYEVLPLAAIHPFAVVLPWMEMASGLCLILGFWTRSAAIALLTLLLAFEGALAVNLYRGASFSCGCFALDGGGTSLQEALIRNVLLIAAALVLLRARTVPLSVDRLLSR